MRLKQRSTLEQTKDRAELATDTVREAALSLRDRADAVLAELDAGEQAKRNRPLLLLLVIGGAVALVYAIRKARGSSDQPEGVPSPGAVTPTAPAGPTDDSLNDPALKAKVESELYADEDVPKGKISIDVADGVVTLRGSLDSSDLAKELADRVRAVEGVRRVENGLAG